MLVTRSLRACGLPARCGAPDLIHNVCPVLHINARRSNDHFLSSDPSGNGGCAEPSLSDVAAEIEGGDLDEYSADASVELATVELAAIHLSPSQSGGTEDTSFAGGEVDSEWSTDDADIDRAHAAQQRARAPRLSEAQLAELRAEGDAKGYGRMYAAMGGGKKGLEACAAGERRCMQCAFMYPSIDVDTVASC